MKNRTLILIVALVALVFLVICGIGAFFYFFWPSTPAVTPAADDSLARVQSSGKIVIGTSADYPPFEYYVSNFKYLSAKPYKKFKDLDYLYRYVY